MIEFFIDNIFEQFGRRFFCQMSRILMGNNCAPLLADLFLYSYGNEFLDNMIKSGHRRLASSINLCYRYIDDLIVFNNKKILDCLKEMYPSQLTFEKADKSDYLADARKDHMKRTLAMQENPKIQTCFWKKKVMEVFQQSQNS